MSTIPTTNETSNVTSLPSTSKTQTAKEVIAANASAMRCCAVFFMGIVSPIQKTCSSHLSVSSSSGVFRSGLVVAHDRNEGIQPKLRDGLADELRESGNLVAAGGFGNVKCAIAEFQQLFEGEVAVADGGDADACAKAELAGVAGNAESGELSLDPVGCDLGVGGVSVGHNYKELVAAEAGDEISGAHGAAEAVGDGAEGEVAG